MKQLEENITCVKVIINLKDTFKDQNVQDDPD